MSNDVDRTESTVGHPNEPWAGIFPAALTMFDSSGRLDEDATAGNLDRLIEQGASGLVVGGTSGEFISLSDAERRRLIALAVNVVAGRVPLIVGTGYYATDRTIELTEYAEAAGADGAIVILPYYQRPSHAEVMQHYLTIGRAVDLPIMVYNNPGNSGAPPLGAPAIRELYEAGCVSAVKSTFPTVHQIHELRAEIDDGLRVFYGSFMAPLEGMAAGAHGWISGILNVSTLDAVILWEAMKAGDLGAARLAWGRILPIKYLYTRELVGPVSDLAIYRGILRLRGERAGYCRKPLNDLSVDQMEHLRQLLASSRLLAMETSSAAGGKGLAERSVELEHGSIPGTRSPRGMPAVEEGGS